MNAQHHGFFAMGTRFDLVLSGVARSKGEALARDLRVECERIERLLSIHDPGSPLSILNHGARSGWMPMDDELRAILTEIDNYHRLTRGYFDPTLNTETESAWEGVQLSREGLRFVHPDIQIDLGGYGKGYAVERLLNCLREAGVEHALISFGESLIYAMGSHPHGEGWPIALPLAGDISARTFLLKDQALSLSGNTFNNQKKFANSGHIVDASSGLTRKESGVVCVLSKNPVEAEIFSTALFGAGQERGKTLEQLRPGLKVKWFMD